MEYIEFNNQIESYEEQHEHLRLIKEIKSMDRGHNVIYRRYPNKKGKLVQTPINIYTSGFIGSNIRNAETGAYYSHIVGSVDEDLYFKVILATGECKSKNCSSTLFYLSPAHYMSHLNSEVNKNSLQIWEDKYNARCRAKNVMIDVKLVN